MLSPKAPPPATVEWPESCSRGRTSILKTETRTNEKRVCRRGGRGQKRRKLRPSWTSCCFPLPAGRVVSTLTQFPQGLKWRVKQFCFQMSPPAPKQYMLRGSIVQNVHTRLRSTPLQQLLPSRTSTQSGAPFGIWEPISMYPHNTIRRLQ